MPVIKQTNQYRCVICAIMHDKDLLDLNARANKTNHVQRAHDQHCMDISERQMSYLGVMVIIPWTCESEGRQIT